MSLHASVGNSNGTLSQLLEGLGETRKEGERKWSEEENVGSYPLSMAMWTSSGSNHSNDLRITSV
jgi:hypothetical protein